MMILIFTFNVGGDNRQGGERMGDGGKGREREGRGEGEKVAGHPESHSDYFGSRPLSGPAW